MLVDTTVAEAVPQVIPAHTIDVSASSQRLPPLDLHPGKGVGPFLLGTPLGDVVSLLVAMRTQYGEVEFLYCPKSLSTQDIVVSVPSLGMYLKFDPGMQRLKVIEFIHLQNIRLRYDGTVFTGPAATATFYIVYRMLGPTHPGDWCAERQLYFLSYPGITFVFSVPYQFAHLCSKDTTDLPVQFPDNTSPPACRISVYMGDSLYDPQLPPLPKDSCYFTPVTASCGEGIEFSEQKCFVRLSASVQEVVSNIGPPSDILYKNKKPEGNTDTGQIDADYFYNYFVLGLDVMFDGTAHTVKKLILHTNVPEATTFCRYAKSNFRLWIGKKKTEIGPDSTWEEIREVCGDPTGKPAVNSCAFGTADDLGHSLYYHYPDFVVEVTPVGSISRIFLSKISRQPQVPTQAQRLTNGKPGASK